MAGIKREGPSPSGGDDQGQPTALTKIGTFRRAASEVQRAPLRMPNYLSPNTDVPPLPHATPRFGSRLLSAIQTYNTPPADGMLLCRATVRTKDDPVKRNFARNFHTVSGWWLGKSEGWLSRDGRAAALHRPHSKPAAGGPHGPVPQAEVC